MNKEQLVGRFIAGTKGKYSNYETDGIILKLHGHVIAQKTESTIKINCCGYPTLTTKSTLNLIHGCDLRTKKGDLFLNGNQISSSEWYNL
jgi:hypothetical protein